MMQALLSSLQTPFLEDAEYSYDDTSITVQSALLPKVRILLFIFSAACMMSSTAPRQCDAYLADNSLLLLPVCWPPSKHARHASAAAKRLVLVCRRCLGCAILMAQCRPLQQQGMCSCRT